MDVLTLLIGAAFLVPFAVSVRRFVQHAGSLELAVLLVFTSTASLFLISAIDLAFPVLAPVLGPVAVVLLVAQPVLMVRLLGLFVPLPRWALPLSSAGFVTSVGLYYLTSRSLPALLFLVTYFALTEVLAAVAFLREARRREGSPRVRLAIAGAASVMFGASIFLSGAASAVRGGGSDPTVTVVSRLIALLAGLGYLVAFVPPSWLREVGHRALAFDLVRSIVATPTGSDPRVLWRELAAAATRVLGTDRVRITTDDGVAVDSSAGLGAAVALGSASAAPPPRPSPRTARVEIALVTTGRTVGSLVAELPGRPLFLEDDVALLALLGSLTARAVEREQAVGALAEAERALTEANALRASEARFRALIDADPNAVLSVEPDGAIRWATRSAAAMFGVDEGGLVGRRLVDLVAPTGDPLGVAEAAGPAGPIVRYETVATTPDGRSFPAEIAESVLELEGEPSRLVVVADVTWRHEESALRDRFIGVLSHELRTPITSIYGGTQVLLHRNRLDEATRRELLVDVAAESERLLRMTDNLLVLARVERGADVAETGPVLLHRLVPKVAEREHATWPAMVLRLDLPATLPLVIGDEASLSLVLRNLISNAGKYAGDGARVDVTASVEPSGEVAVRVCDDGPGIDPADAEHVFELYYRARSTAAAPGSGIGLFVCRQLVEAMGGRCWAARRPGGGTEFGFTLPVYVEEARPAGISAPASSEVVAPLAAAS